MADKTVSYYRGIPMKDHPIIRLRVSQYEFKKFIDYRLDQDLSARQVLEASVQRCQKCSLNDITFFDKNDNEKKIKKGILTQKK